MTVCPEKELQSLCPVCLKRIPAWHRVWDEDVFLDKKCPEHGFFSTPVWRGSPSLEAWAREKIPSPPDQPATAISRGCPFDCGLCPDHRQHTCTAVLEITSRCNLACPVCFASAHNSARIDKYDIPLQKVEFMLASVMEASGACNIQLSGGEPSLRNDLDKLVGMARAMGFPFVQLNSNGLRFADEPDFARRLADSGLDSVFFQFDGTRDNIYEKNRGRSLLAKKNEALNNIISAGLGVVLVPTVVPGVNDDNLGDILRFAAQRSPGVRGVHFQPVSYFGRYPVPPAPANRITLPEVMRLLEEQTFGQVLASDFIPPGCEHFQCSFHANYLVAEDLSLRRISANLAGCDCSPASAARGADKAKEFVRRQWSAPACCSNSSHSTQPGCRDDLNPGDDLDLFLARAATHMRAVSGMAFQDVWTLDLERLQGCCIHEVSTEGRLIPFCAYNLTAMDGAGLYRK